MEDMKKEQLEVLNEAKGYCTNVLHCIDTVVPERDGTVSLNHCILLERWKIWSFRSRASQEARI